MIHLNLKMYHKRCKTQHNNAYSLSFAKVYDFFKERIEAQYPLHDDSKSSPYEHMAEQHESFMKNKAECVFGREAITTKVRDRSLII